MKKSNLEWWITGIVGIGSFLLGMYGFNILFEKTNPERSPIDLAFYSLRLFGMEFPDDYKSPLPLELEIARWISPFVILFAAFKAVLLILHSEFSVLLLRFKKGRVIISAHNMQSDHLIKDLVKYNHKVVLIADRSEFKANSSYSRRGVICVDGDLASESFLKSIAAHRSEAIVFMANDDDKNLEETYAVYDYLKKNGKDRNQLLLTHVANDLKMSELEDINFFQSYSTKEMNNDNCHIRTFSSYERAARVLFNEYSPDRFKRIKSPEDPQMHIALIGSGQLAQSMLLRFARLGHYANLKKLKITLFHEDEKMLPRLEGNIKSIREFVDLDLIPEDLNSTSDDLYLFDSGKFMEIHQKHPFTAVYLLCEDDSLSSNILNKLSKLKLESPLDTILSLVNPKGILNKWYNITNLKSLRIHKFNLIEKVFTRESLFNDKLDELAKFIHGDYFNSLPDEIKDCYERRPTQYPWDELSNENRNANREQADHLEIKARAIGVSVDDMDKIHELSDAEIEVLSEMEHNRWWANKALSGHIYGPKKIDSEKIHCDLVKYSKLDESTKEYDRNTIRNIPELLARKNKQDTKV